MSLPDELQPGNNFCSAANDYYPTELEASPAWLAQDWLFTDLENSPIDPLTLCTPPINLSEKPLDVFGCQTGDPFGVVLPIPTTVSGADLNISLAPNPLVGNLTSQPSRTTSGSDDSLLLGSKEVSSGGDLLSKSFTTLDDPDVFRKPTYKPGWATANGGRESESTPSSTPQSKKRGKTSISPAKSRRTSPRNLSLSITPYEAEDKEESEELSSPETTDPNASKNKRSHNLTEKKYRTRLNGYFETLLSVIPKPTGTGESNGTAAEAPEKKISKGEVLVLAMEYIRELERDQTELEQQRKSLSSDMEHLKDVSTGMENEMMVY
jgi:hypothetical protein